MAANAARGPPVSVAHVRDEENPSDFLTKAISVAKTEASIRYALGAPLDAEQAPTRAAPTPRMHE